MGHMEDAHVKNRKSNKYLFSKPLGFQPFMEMTLEIPKK